MEADDYKIEDGFPAPPPNKGGRPVKLPFAQMKVGQSFFIDMTGKTRTQINTRRGNTLQLIRSYRQRGRIDKTWEFAARIVDNGIRIWRVE